MFMLIIWLQGIWLPQHGYSFESTPLWAGIYMLPLTVGFLVAGPISGHPLGPLRLAAVRDRRACSARRSASCCSSGCPIDFSYPLVRRHPAPRWGSSMGAFAAPNRAGVMNSLPAGDRGAGGGMNQTFQNSAQVLSIGIFFTLMIIGLAATLPHAAHGRARGARRAAATARARRRSCRPSRSLFAAFLGYDPVQHADRPARARASLARRTRPRSTAAASSPT